MELLSKQQIAQKSAQERKIQIDEGVKLAKRVDDLRMKVNEETSTNQKFKQETQKQMNIEIEKLNVQKTLLVNEIEELEVRKATARIPLDAEWELLESKQTSFDLKSTNLDEKDHFLGQKEAELKIFETEIAQKKANLEDEKAKNDAFFEYLKNFEKNLANQQSDIGTNAQAVEKQLAGREGDVKRREDKVSVREHDVVLREKHIDADRIALNQKESSLLDREGVLQRNLSRTQNV